MKTFFLVLDALNPDKASTDFAFYLARLSKSKVYGLFLGKEHFDKEEIEAVYDFNMNYYSSEQTNSNYLKKDQIKMNMQLFRESCISNEVCSDQNISYFDSLDQLIEHSRFADLLLIDAALSLDSNSSKLPSSSVKELLNKVFCPVIIPPSSFKTIDEIVFTYDNSNAAIYALKQFTYLFPEFFSINISLVQVSKSSESKLLKHEQLAQWLKNHYSNVSFIELEGNTESELLSFLLSKKHVFVIMGAFGRSSISQFFNESKAEVLMKALNHPIFITH